MKRAWKIICTIATVVLGVTIGLWFWTDLWTSEPVLSTSSLAPGASVLAFVGSAKCAACHTAQYEAWQTSQHARAMQPANAATVLGRFNARLRHGLLETSFSRRGDSFVVRTDGVDGKAADFEVKYTFGIFPLQQYLVDLPGGRLQALPIVWDARPGGEGGQRWFHLYPDESLDFSDELHWTRRTQNWNFMCADCHSTHVHKAYDATSDTYATQWSELNVACEACHGPGSRHVAWATSGRAHGDPGLTARLVDRHSVKWTIEPESGAPHRVGAPIDRREVEICAPCHARRSQVAEGYYAGLSFMDFYRPELLRSPLYHADGQQLDEVFTWGSFLQSRMFQAGVTCNNCHDAHTGRLRAEGNALCAQCHIPSRYDDARHTHHDKNSQGSGCVDCHMPSTTYMRIDARRDHSLRVPRPDLTRKTGAPNPCNGCHQDRDARWADETITAWLGRPPRGLQDYAEAFAAAANGQADGLPRLIAVTKDESQPAIARASAVAALAEFPSAATSAPIRSAASSSDPLLRRAAAAASVALAAHERRDVIAPLLNDSLRTVRLEAVQALADVPASSFSTIQHDAFERAAREFEQAQRFNADRPEARSTLGMFFAAQGRLAEAQRELDSAIQFDGSFAPAYVNLADVLRVAGNEPAAEAALRRGLERIPEDASLHQALGLTLVRTGRANEALGEFGAAARMEPGNAWFAYVHALALRESGHTDAAGHEIERALKLSPEDSRFLLAAQQLARTRGDISSAAAYEVRLQRIYATSHRAAR